MAKGNISDKQRKAMHANMKRRGVALGKTPQGMDSDLNKSVNVVPDTPANRKIWEKPGGSRRMDIAGIDTKPMAMIDKGKPKPVPAVKETTVPPKENDEVGIGDMVVSPEGRQYTVKKIIAGMILATNDTGGAFRVSKSDAVKAMTLKQAENWIDHERKAIEKETRGNEEILIKKQITDRFNKALHDGEMTQAQYNDSAKDGTILSMSDYSKALDVQAKIDAIKNREIPKPEGWQDKRIKQEADLLKWEAAHPPKELQPPKEYTESETKNFIWGNTENDAIKQYEDKEIKRLTSNIAYAENADKLYADAKKKYDKLNRKEKTDPINDKLRRDYYQWKEEAGKFHNMIGNWQNGVQRVKNGGYAEFNKKTIHESYVNEVKTAIKKGKPVPFDVIKQYPEFTKAQTARERYNKGKHTSFANVSIAVDDSKKEMHGVKIKLQNGKEMNDKRADQIIATLSQFQSAVGDITRIMRKENLTVAHTSDKHPFLSTYAGLYHPNNKTVTMGMEGVAAHEYTHFIDETAKEHKSEKDYDYGLLAQAKLAWNSGAKQATSLSTRKNKEQLKDARELRVHLGSYWYRPEEIFARLGEQYTAYKNRGLTWKEQHYTNEPFEYYTQTPAYWSEEEFDKLIPAFEIELKRKIELAGREA